MTLQEFASKYRLTIARDPDDFTSVIRGRKGASHVFEYGPTSLAVLVMPLKSSVHWWHAARKAFQTTGMVITQNGDGEGVATFDPTNDTQVQLAIKYAGIKRKRLISEEQRTKLAETLAKARNFRLEPCQQSELTV